MKRAETRKVSILVFMFLVVLVFFVCFVPTPALGDTNEKWLDGWDYRKSHVIERTTEAGTNYQVSLIVDYGDGYDLGDTVYVDEKCRSDFQDIRFTGEDGETELDYWMEEYEDSEHASFWVEVADDLSVSDVTIYVYYGNYEALTTSNGDETFLLFNDFSSAIEYTSFPYSIYPWGVVHGTDSGTFSLASGVLEAKQGVISSHIMALSSLNHDNVAVSVKVNFDLLENIEEIGISARCSIDGYYINHYYLRAIHNTDSNRYGLELMENYDVDEYCIGRWNFTHSEFTWYTLELQLCNNLLTVYQNGIMRINVTDNTISSGNKIGLMSGFTLNVAHSYDDFIVRKCVNPEPAHGDWGAEEGDFAPTITSFAILDMDDTDNLYAQKRYYTAQYVVTDYDGYTDIDYAEFSITQSSKVHATFRFDEDTSTFSIESGNSMWELDIENCSYVSSGKNLTMNFMISPKFNAIEESGIDISAFVLDETAEKSSETVQTNYADVVTDLVVSKFACDDDRGNVGQSLDFSGYIFYANDPSSEVASSCFPPDSEFKAVHVYDSRDNSQKSDKSMINGTFSVSFSALPSVGLEAYTVYIDMADEEYTDAEESPVVTFITDRIRILTLGVNDTRINVNDSAKITATAELEYDGQTLGSEDNLTVESIDFVWNGTHFVGTESKNSVQQKVYSNGNATETSYGITVLNMNSLSVSVIWDRLNVQFTVDNDLVPLNTETKFSVTIFREYDNSSVSSYSYNINRDDSAFNNPHTTAGFTDVSSLEETRVYDLTDVTDNTYGLTVFTDPNNLFVAWYDEGIQMSQIIVAVTLTGIVTVTAIALLAYIRRKRT